MTEARYPPAQGGARSKNPIPPKPVSFEKDYTKVKNRIPLDRLANRFPKPCRRRYASLEDLSQIDRQSRPSPSFETPIRRRDVNGETVHRPDFHRRNEENSTPVQEQRQRPDVPKIDFTIKTLARDEPKKNEPSLTPGNLSSIMESSRSDDESCRNDSLRGVDPGPEDTLSQLNDTFTAIMNFSSELDTTDDKLDTSDGGDEKRDRHKLKKVVAGEYPGHPQSLKEADKSLKLLSNLKTNERTPDKPEDVKRVDFSRNESLGNSQSPKDSNKYPKQPNNTKTYERHNEKSQDVTTAEISLDESLGNFRNPKDVNKSPKHLSNTKTDERQNEKSENVKKAESERDEFRGNSRSHTDANKSPKRQTNSQGQERTPNKEDLKKLKVSSSSKAECGEIITKEEDRRKAKYLRITDGMSGSDIIHAQQKYWDIALPHIILSVFGDLSCWGTLLEAAESLGAWVMVDGTKNIKCPIHKDSTCEVHCGRATCIGIGDMAKVSKAKDNKKGERQSKHNAVVDERPSHFMFMEGVSSENYYKTRSRMEHDMAREMCVPRVVLIHQKEEEESLPLLNVIHEAMHHNTPVLFTEKSSLVRDIIQYVIQFQEKNTSVKNTIEEEHTSWFPKKDVSNVLEKVVLPEYLDRQIENVKHCSEHTERFRFLSTDITRRVPMTKTLQLEIIEAILKAQRSRGDDNDVSNCHCCENGEAVDNDILIKSPASWTLLPSGQRRGRHRSKSEAKISTDGEGKGNTVQVSNLAVILLGTLLSDDASCVKALLNGGVDLKCASIAAILYLYRDVGYTTLIEVEADIRNLYGNILNRQLYQDSKENVDCRDVVEKMNAGFHWLTSEEASKGKKLVTDFDIFIWSILMNKVNITRLLWERGKDQMSWALIASHILQRMNETGSEASTCCQLTMSKKFTKNACQILDEMYESGPGNAKDVLQEENESESSSLIVAADTSNRTFLSHDGCQSLLHETLCGQIHQNNSVIMVIICVVFPILIPWLVQFSLNRHQRYSMENTEFMGHRQHPGSRSLPGKVKAFYSSPLVKFIIHMMFNTCLLLLYGYVLLFDMNGFDLSVHEIILHIWIITSIVDDMRQIFVKSKERSIKGKLQYHCVCVWNRVEVLGTVLFCIGLPLRLTYTKETFELGRILLCVNFVLHAVRISTLYFQHTGLGAKLIILEKMAQDLIHFVLMFLVIVFSFGIAILALLIRDKHIQWDLLSTDLFSLPYIYVLREFYPKSISGLKSQSNITAPMEFIATVRTHAALCLTVIYILICILLLMNLVVSIFRRLKTAFNTETLDDERYYGPFHFQLVRDYVLKPSLPPPFCVLCYIYKFIHKIISRDSKQQGNAFSKISTPSRLKYLVAWQKKIVEEYLKKTTSNH